MELNGLTLSGQNIKRDFTPVLTNRWHNSARPMDVNNDKVVAPQDVLIIINDLNARGGRKLPYITSPPQYLLDVNRDNALLPADALQIINHLNSRSGEGESRVSGWIEMQRTAPTTAAMPETLEDEPAEALASRSAAVSATEFVRSCTRCAVRLAGRGG